MAEGDHAFGVYAHVATQGHGAGDVVGLRDHQGAGDAVDVAGADAGVVGVEAVRVGDYAAGVDAEPGQVGGHRGGLVAGAAVAVAGDQHDAGLAGLDQGGGGLEAAGQPR
jgi:hypothetical protein